MKCCAAAIIALALWGGGCGRSKPAVVPSDGDSVGNGDEADAAVDTVGDSASEEAPPLVLPPECADAALPPPTLVCTGLYADIVGKQLAPGIEAYAPAVPLWSDG